MYNDFSLSVMKGSSLIMLFTTGISLGTGDRTPNGYLAAVTISIYTLAWVRLQAEKIIPMFGFVVEAQGSGRAEAFRAGRAIVLIDATVKVFVELQALFGSESLVTSITLVRLFMDVHMALQAAALGKRLPADSTPMAG